MRKFFLGIVVSIIIIFGIGSTPASALIFLSGDGNIATCLEYGTTECNEDINGSSRQFFKNVLQGGSNVAVLESYDPSPGLEPGTYDTIVDDFYGSLTGVSSSVLQEVTEAGLASVDLFVVPVPPKAFVVDEVDAVAGFLSGGGSLFLLGEAESRKDQNAYINGLLSDLGSQMRIVDDGLKPGFPHPLVPGQVATDPFTKDVTTLQYGYVSRVSLGATGKPLFYVEDSDGELEPFVAYAPYPIPEPTTVILLGVGLIGLLALGRKRSKK